MVFLKSQEQSRSYKFCLHLGQCWKFQLATKNYVKTFWVFTKMFLGDFIKILIQEMNIIKVFF